ncbi:MAG: hypothetical protein HOY75_03300, partial [Streptomyces sp.]|nr:hypothetical protein [Streptomyces sp.]
MSGLTASITTRDRHQHQTRRARRGPEAVPGRAGRLDEPGYERDHPEHGRAHDERHHVGGRRGPAAQHPEVDQRRADPQFDGGQRGERDGRAEQQTDDPGRAPAPCGALPDAQQQTHQRAPQQRRADRIH